MLQITYQSQPFQYRLAAAIPHAGLIGTYNPYLITPPRVYGEEWDHGITAIFLNPEDLADGYQVIWLGLTQNMVWFPGYNFTWYRFNGTTGQYLGRVDSAIGQWLFSIFGQSRDGTLWKVQNSVAPYQAFACIATADGVTVSATPSFDFTGFEGLVGVAAFLIDTEQNLFLANTGGGGDNTLKVWNLTTGKLLRTVSLPAAATVIMAVDASRCYAMTACGVICLVDFQAGVVLSTFAVQENTNLSASAFSSYRTIAYDQTYRRFLTWNYTPVDGSGQNTSQVLGYFPVPVPVGLTKPIPLRAARKYRTVPVLARMYGDMGESAGGGVVAFSVSDPTLGAITSFPALTDTDCEAVASLDCIAAGAPTVTASVALAAGIGGSGGAGEPPAPPPLPSSVRQPGDFPRLGGYLVSGSIDYDNPARAAQIAKLDVAVLGFTPGWTGSSALTMAQAVLAIKALNPRIVLVNYTDPFQDPPSYNASAFAEASTMIGNPTDSSAGPAHRDQWYVFDHAFTPVNIYANKVPSPWGGSLVNFTAWNNPPNILNQHYNEWRADFDTTYSVRSALSLDGIYVDHTTRDIAGQLGPVPSSECNVSSLAIGSVLGDWDRGELLPWPPPYPFPQLYGAGPPPTPLNYPDDSTTVNNAWLAGIADFSSRLRANMGAGKFVFANLRDWNTALPGVLTYLANGGVIESLIGQPSSYETTSFAAMMSAYNNVMVALAAPAYGIFAHDGSLTDYQDMRYGLCACLMEDGYYYHSDGASAGGYHNVNWFDEFNFNLGAASAAVLRGGGGVAWQNGVWRRDFANGIALVNPKGNGAQTVTLEKSYKKLTGAQAPAVNDGSTVTAVTLQDRDGLILMRIP